MKGTRESVEMVENSSLLRELRALVVVAFCAPRTLHHHAVDPLCRPVPWRFKSLPACLLACLPAYAHPDPDVIELAPDEMGWVGVCVVWC
ncbi:hypothetical protein M0804_010610 [Polistes exclamans]|nr:hypothetical protein M0804_010610 [Polistes exclamans]